MNDQGCAANPDPGPNANVPGPRALAAAEAGRQGHSGMGNTPKPLVIICARGSSRIRDASVRESWKSCLRPQAEWRAEARELAELLQKGADMSRRNWFRVRRVLSLAVVQTELSTSFFTCITVTFLLS